MSRAIEIILLVALILASSLVFSGSSKLNQKVSNAELSIESTLADGISTDQIGIIINLSYEILQRTDKQLLVLADSLDIFLTIVNQSIDIVRNTFRQIWCYL